MSTKKKKKKGIFKITSADKFKSLTLLNSTSSYFLLRGKESKYPIRISQHKLWTMHCLSLARVEKYGKRPDLTKKRKNHNHTTIGWVIDTINVLSCFTHSRSQGANESISSHMVTHPIRLIQSNYRICYLYQRNWKKYLQYVWLYLLESCKSMKTFAMMPSFFII